MKVILNHSWPPLKALPVLACRDLRKAKTLGILVEE